MISFVIYVIAGLVLEFLGGFVTASKVENAQLNYIINQHKYARKYRLDHTSRFVRVMAWLIGILLWPIILPISILKLTRIPSRNTKVIYIPDKYTKIGFGIVRIDKYEKLELTERNMTILELKAWLML